MAVAKDDKVKWAEIKALAEKVDTLWDDKMPQGGRANGPSCCLSQKGSIQTSYKTGIPILTQDVTTPFPGTFGANAEDELSREDAPTLYQRFEFAYYNEFDSRFLNLCAKAPTDNRAATMYAYPNYLAGYSYPVLHSQFLVSSPEGPVGATTADGSAIHYMSTADLASYIMCSPGNVGNLIESRLDWIHEWWPECDSFRRKNPTISGELYFVATPGETESDAAMENWKGRCPCGGVFRVAFAANNCNGNGNSPLNGSRYYPLCNKTVHTWDMSTESVQRTTGLTGTGTTLTQKDWDQLLPESNKDVKLYQPPPAGCCPTVVFPKLGYLGGGCKFNVFARQILMPGFKGDRDKWSYKVEWSGTLREYNELTSENIPVEYRLTTRYPHIDPHELDKYDADVEANADGKKNTYSVYSLWTGVCGRVSDGITTGSGYVRCTCMKFTYTEDGQYFPDPTGHEDEIMVDIVYVPTSITLPITGTFQPAIRKRWYDMLYYKLRWIIGCFPPDNNIKYPMGTTWDAGAEGELSKRSRMASFWLGEGISWEEYETYGVASYEETQGMPPLLSEEHTMYCVPWGAESSYEYYNYADQCPAHIATNSNLCNYIPTSEQYASLKATDEFYFGEKYMEQLLCAKNLTDSFTIECPGQSDPGEWNNKAGCYCSELVQASGDTRPWVEDPVEYECSGNIEYSKEEGAGAEQFWNGEQSGRVGMRNPKPDDCIASGEDSYSPDYPTSGSQFRFECMTYACKRDIILPWEGGCGNENCECLECGEGPKTYAASVNLLNTIADYTGAHKVSENSMQLTSTSPWLYFYRTGTQGDFVNVYYRPRNDTPASEGFNGCGCQQLEEIMVTSTALHDHGLCHYFAQPGANALTNSQARDTDPVYVENNAESSLSEATLNINLTATTQPTVEDNTEDPIPVSSRSPIQIGLWKTILVPQNGKVNIKMSITSSDLKKLLAIYWQNDPAWLSGEGTNYWSYEQPVCGYMTGHLYTGPYTSKPNLVGDPFMLVPWGTEGYTSRIYNQYGDQECNRVCTGDYITNDNIDFEYNEDTDEWVFERQLEFEQLNHQYRKLVFIALTIDHDGFGMHGGGPASDYTYDPTTFDRWECSGSDSQHCIASLLTGAMYTGSEISPYKSGTAKFKLELTQL